MLFLRLPYSEPGKTKVLFVKNLSFDITIDELRDFFDGATNARIATYPDSGKSKGYVRLYLVSGHLGTVQKFQHFSV